MTPLPRSSFYFAHDDAFLIPVEHLDDRGISAAFAAEIAERGVAAESFRRMFDEAFARLGSTLARLSRALPDVFVPPRLVNVVVLRGASRWMPYFRPFEGMSVVVYAADFDDATSTAEHAAFQLLVSERISMTRRASAAVREAIPYLLDLDEGGAERFCQGARRSTRPDAEVARALAELLPSLRARTRCEGLHANEVIPPEFARIKGTPLFVDRPFASELAPVLAAADSVARRLSEQHDERQREGVGAGPPARVAAFLERERPRVLVVDAGGAILWDPERAEDTAAMRRALAQTGDRPAQSIIDDLRTVDDLTKIFFASVRGASGFTFASPSLEQDGGVYVHPRGLLAYAIEQPTFAPCREEAPPYHRLLLAARAMHELGHIAVDAGVVPIPEANRLAFGAARARLREVFARIVNQLPRDAANAAEEELRAMRDEGTQLADLPFSRMEDYRANLLAKLLLPDAALQAYVRANVRSLAAEEIGALRKLARYAYEAQYLWLADLEDPWQYLRRSTYIEEEYVGAGVLGADLLRELVRAVGALCRAYEVDTMQLVTAAREEPAP